MARQAHRSGLVAAVGGNVGVVTAGTLGGVMLWPEAELRGVAESAGFVLPQRPHTGTPAKLNGLQDLSGVRR